MCVCLLAGVGWELPPGIAFCTDFAPRDGPHNLVGPTLLGECSDGGCFGFSFYVVFVLSLGFLLLGFGMGGLTCAE